MAAGAFADCGISHRCGSNNHAANTTIWARVTKSGWRVSILFGGVVVGFLVLFRIVWFLVILFGVVARIVFLGVVLVWHFLLM
jgi:hypothetical protein